MDNEAWVGRWVRESEEGCTGVYPSTLVFRAGGIFDAPGAPEEGARFHSGDWELRPGPPAVLALQAANDAMVPHRVEEEGAGRVVLEAEGCRVRYRRGG